MTAIEYGVNIEKLSDEDLIRYEDFLFEKLLGVVQSERRRMSLLDRIDSVRAEKEARSTCKEAAREQASQQRNAATSCEEPHSCTATRQTARVR